MQQLQLSAKGLSKKQELEIKEDNMGLRVEDLSRRLKSLEQRIIILEQENVALKQENSELRAENDRLRERLQLNSRTSSLPPSRDLYKANRKNRLKSERNPGGQPGHKPHSYQQQEADEIIDLFPDVCSCGHALEIIDTFCVDQKIELPSIKPYVTEYHRWQGVCRGCGKKKTAPLPEGVQSDLLGDRAKAVISSLSGFFNNSKRDVQQILENIFNLPISLGLVSATEKRVNKTLASTYKDLVNQMEDSAYLHIDETGHNCRGKRGWGWMFTNRDMSILKLTSSRGKKVLESMLPEYEGMVISDRYGAYRHFEEKKRQICWSHLKRDFERIAQSRNTLLACQGESLGNISRDVFALDKDFKTGTISRFFYKIRMRKIKKRMLHALKGILMIPDVPHAHRVAKNLLDSFDMMWRFVENSEIDLTNNLAERQIRKYVIYRKKSFFTWSQRGNEFMERTLSLFLTCRLRKQNAFLKLFNIIAAAD